MKILRLATRPLLLLERRFLLAVIDNRVFVAGALFLSLFLIRVFIPAWIAFNAAPKGSDLRLVLEIISFLWVLGAVPKLWKWYCMMGEIQRKPGPNLSNVLANQRLKLIDDELKVP